MKLILSIHLLIFLFPSFSQTYINYDIMSEYVEKGTASKYFPSNGKGKTIDGKKEGEWKEYLFDSFSYYKFENGKVNGKRESLLTWGEGNYKNGKRSGVWKIYLVDHPSRKKHFCLEANYSDGLRNGNITFYFPTGEIAAKGTMKNDELENVLTCFYPSGTVFQELTYVNGNGEGESTIYHENGNIKTEVNYCKGLACGIMKEYYPDGKIRFERHYKAGYQDGMETEYYPDGTIMSNVNWKKVENEDRIVMDGIFTYYYPTGSIWVERIYKDGLFMGIKSLFDNKGNPLDYGTIENGNGTVKFYTEDGKIYKIGTYKDGKEIVSQIK